MSEHKDIWAALLAAQPNFQKPAKNKKGAFDNVYADLDAVVDAVRPALNAEGIVYLHLPESSELGDMMRTLLHHPSSGTQIECPVPMLIGKRDSQGYRSASTYAKRIGLESATGVAPSDDDDADGERKGNDMGAALKDSWKQGVLDRLPENASPAEKADAFATAIMADFQGKGAKALENRWKKHQSMIAELQGRFPSLYEDVLDAYAAAQRANEDGE